MKYWKWFYNITAVIYGVCVIISIATNTSDIFAIWPISALIVGMYLIDKKESK